VLTDLAVMLADSGDAISDLPLLRDQPTVFGPPYSHVGAAFTMISCWSCRASDYVRALSP
jgi:hypothetical protein